MLEVTQPAGTRQGFKCRWGLTPHLRLVLCLLGCAASFASWLLLKIEESLQVMVNNSTCGKCGNPSTDAPGSVLATWKHLAHPVGTAEQLKLRQEQVGRAGAKLQFQTPKLRPSSLVIHCLAVFICLSSQNTR